MARKGSPHRVAPLRAYPTHPKRCTGLETLPRLHTWLTTSSAGLSTGFLHLLGFRLPAAGRACFAHYDGHYGPTCFFCRICGPPHKAHKGSQAAPRSLNGFRVSPAQVPRRPSQPVCYPLLRACCPGQKSDKHPGDRHSPALANGYTWILAAGAAGGVAGGGPPSLTYPGDFEYLGTHLQA